MGLLRNLRTGREVALGARVLVGRAGSCTLQVDSRVVSNEHAALWWEDGAWKLRDAGSRNGTRLDGRALEAGERVTVPAGGVLVFGHEEHSWVLVDAGPPVALARAADGTLARAESGVLCLPSVAEPEVMVFEGADGRWVAEGAEGTDLVKDGSAVVAGGRAWVLQLPLGDTSTWAPAGSPMALATISLRFRVSQDEEYIEVDVEHLGRTVKLETRTHFELLLTLARARLEDAAHAEAEQGWRYNDDLRRMLGLEPGALNVQIYRARQQLGDAQVAGAAGVIERRATTGQLRLGVARVEVGGL